MPHTLLQSQLPPGAGQWIALAVAVGAIAFVMFRPKLMKRGKDALDTNQSPLARMSLSRQREVEQQMSNLLVELSDMARQITAQLDSRAAKLDLLIKEADEKIAALKAAGGGAAPPSSGFQMSPVSDMPPAPPPEAPRSAPTFDPPDPAHQQVYALADEGCTSMEISQKVGRPEGEIRLILALRPRS